MQLDVGVIFRACHLPGATGLRQRAEPILEGVEGWRGPPPEVVQRYRLDDKSIGASNVFRATTRNLSSVRASASKWASFAADEARGGPCCRGQC